jgi:hypothetical protein
LLPLAPLYWSGELSLSNNDFAGRVVFRRRDQRKWCYIVRAAPFFVDAATMRSRMLFGTCSKWLGSIE